MVTGIRVGLHIQLLITVRALPNLSSLFPSHQYYRCIDSNTNWKLDCSSLGLVFLEFSFIPNGNDLINFIVGVYRIRALKDRPLTRLAFCPIHLDKRNLASSTLFVQFTITTKPCQFKLIFEFLDPGNLRSTKYGVRTYILYVLKGS